VPFWSFEAGGHDIGIQIIFGHVVRRHFVMLAAFFVEPQPPAPALLIGDRQKLGGLPLSIGWADG
jgi:hypothetical protein